MRQARNSAHVPGDTADAIKQQPARFETRIAHGKLQMSPIRDDVVLGAGVKRTDGDDARIAGRQFMGNERLQRQDDLASEHDRILAAVRRRARPSREQ